MSEDKDRKKASTATDQDKEEISQLGLDSLSDAGFSRLSEGKKPNEPEKRKPFTGFS